jgi:tetratricopeptide (TPR) repeat protein
VGRPLQDAGARAVARENVALTVRILRTGFRASGDDRIQPRGKDAAGMRLSMRVDPSSSTKRWFSESLAGICPAEAVNWLGWPVLLFLLMTAVVARPAAAAEDECPATYKFEELPSSDYLDPSAQKKIQGIEAHHFTSDVEDLIRGKAQAGVGGELAFVLNWIPNHHRALQALVRLALRDKTEKPYQTDPYTVTCWLHRAMVFSPQDGQVYLIYGVYLARIGKYKQAQERLETADSLLVNNANVSYNLGLVFYELKDYERALERAKRAYASGFPLPGLRQKLVQAGVWRD